MEYNAVYHNIHASHIVMLRIIFTSLIIFFSSKVLSENLVQSDFIGEWIADRAAVKNEKQKLNISFEDKSVFIRIFEDFFSIQKLSFIEPEAQTLRSDSIKLIEDTLVLKFTSNDGLFSYKFALSGWKKKDEKKLYGTMFMYRKGKQFNGLPVSFIPAK